MKNIAIFGAGGAIGGALMDELNQKHPESVIHTFSRTPILSDHPNIHGYSVDYLSEQSIMECADKIKEPLDLVIIAIGRRASVLATGCARTICRACIREFKAATRFGMVQEHVT